MTETEFFMRIEKALERKRQVILYGPPGTGKTYSVKRYIDWKNGKTNQVLSIVYKQNNRASHKAFIEGETMRLSTTGKALAVKDGLLAFVCDYINSRVWIQGLAKIKNVNRASNENEKTTYEYEAVRHFRYPIDISDIIDEQEKDAIENLEEQYNSKRISHSLSQIQQIIKKMRDNGETLVADLVKTYEMCTFHPSFTYEDFIEGYKPSDDGDAVSFTLQDGIFKRYCSSIFLDSPYYFVIDEINRGNLPKIFGELITLLEKDKRGEEVILPYSKEPFSIPENLYLIGTMNTSDRSIKMMDAAFKRRFAFIEVMPDASLINDEIEELELSPGEILEQLNTRLIDKLGRDKQIGHAYFMQDGEQIETVEELRDIFDMDIIPLIQEYCHNDYRLLADIVGNDFVKSKTEINRDLFDDDIDVFIEAIKKQYGKKA